MEGALDPFLGRHQAGFLSGQVDTGFMADTEAACIVGEPVDAELNADVVKEEVARLQNLVGKIEDSMGRSALFGVIDPAVVWAAEEGAVSGAKSREIL